MRLRAFHLGSRGGMWCRAHAINLVVAVVTHTRVEDGRLGRLVLDDSVVAWGMDEGEIRSVEERSGALGASPAEYATTFATVLNPPRQYASRTQSKSEDSHVCAQRGQRKLGSKSCRTRRRDCRAKTQHQMVLMRTQRRNTHLPEVLREEDREMVVGAV